MVKHVAFARNFVRTDTCQCVARRMDDITGTDVILEKTNAEVSNELVTYLDLVKVSPEKWKDDKFEVKDLIFMNVTLQHDLKL